MENKILTYQIRKDFEGFLVSEIQELENIKWNSNKIEWSSIQEVISFFLWQHRTFKTESQLRLLRHENGSFIFIPFYQYIETGLQSNEVKDSIENTRLTEHYLKNGYHFFGSIHHHCSVNAFQSGTDYQDEIKINGFHFTIGNLDQKKLGLHGRFVFRGICYKIDLLEIFENLDFLEIDNIPVNIFPFEWTERLLEKPKIENPVYENEHSIYDYYFEKSEKTENDINLNLDFELELEKIENDFFDVNIDTDYLYFLKLSDNQTKNKILELIDFLSYVNIDLDDSYELIEFLENIKNLTRLELQKIKKLLEEI
jgi:hypothetical protein